MSDISKPMSLWSIFKYIVWGDNSLEKDNTIESSNNSSEERKLCNWTKWHIMILLELEPCNSNLNMHKTLNSFETGTSEVEDWNYEADLDLLKERLSKIAEPVRRLSYQCQK